MRLTKSNISTFAGLITAAIAAIGTITTLANVGSGHSFSVPQMAFYCGVIALEIYGSIIFGLLVSSGFLGILSYLSRTTSLFYWENNDPPEKTVYWSHSIFVLAAFVVAILGDFGPDGFFDYYHISSGYRGFVGIVGVCSIALGIFIWRRLGSNAEKDID
jgi:hypothetical protein